MTDRQSLENRSRAELVARAHQLGIERPERMTREELCVEISRASDSSSQNDASRSLFGVARTMLAGVVERGLNLPDAARRIRGNGSIDVPDRNRSPVATVTLAEIYAAQGHKARALRMLDEVLGKEPDHEAAAEVRRKLLEGDMPSQMPPASSSRADGESPVELPGETTEYVPGGFVETTGEEIRTGNPPAVQPGMIIDKPAVFWRQFADHAQVYWEMPRSALSECGLDEKDGRAALHVVGFVPHGAQPQRKQATLQLEAEWDRGYGVATVLGYGEGVVLRVAVGWESDGAFIPLCVGRPLEEALAGLPVDEELGDDTAVGRAEKALPL